MLGQGCFFGLGFINSVRAIKPVVLIVEDEPLIRMGLADVCADAGFEVLEAIHGLAALDQLRAREDIALVLSDIDMPVMDGVALARAVGQQHAHVAVVLTSGKTYLLDGEVPAEIPFLPKPVNEGLLISTLWTLFERFGGGSPR